VQLLERSIEYEKDASKSKENEEEEVRAVFDTQRELESPNNPI